MPVLLALAQALAFVTSTLTILAGEHAAGVPCPVSLATTTEAPQTTNEAPVAQSNRDIADLQIHVEVLADETAITTTAI
jgi:hypothetical protein